VSAAANAASATNAPPPTFNHVIAFIFLGPGKITGLPMEIRGHPDWRRMPHVEKAGQIERIESHEAPRETN
jgi:hypothetical protein